VKTPAVTMQQVYTLTKAMYFGAMDAQAAAARAASMREQVAKLQAQGELAKALADFDRQVGAVEGARPAAGPGGRGGGPAGGGRGGAPTDAQPDTLWSVATSLAGLMNSMQAADVAPTSNTLQAVTAAQQRAARVMARWNALRTVDLQALNAKLKAAGLTTIVE
jgi:hypothetical protein